MGAPPTDLPAYQLIGGVLAWLLVGVLHVGIPLLMVLVATTRSISAAVRARAAEARATTEERLAPGPACIYGPVELAPGSNHAVRVTIEQVGKNRQTKNGWSHTWTEVSRRVSANPFYVKDTRGRVRVEPDPRTSLVDQLDRTQPIAGRRDRRERIAEATPGEYAYVVGELDPGHDPTAGTYRGGEATLVMRPPRGGRLLVSTEPLDARLQEVSRGQRRWALGFVGLALVFALLDLGFWARVAFGRTEVATITQAIPRRSKNSRYCGVIADLPSHRLIDVDADLPTCAAVPVGAKTIVYVVGDESFAHVGSTPAVHNASVFVGALFLLIAVLVYSQRDKPWYEEKVVNNGSGTFEETLRSRPVS